MIHEVRTRLMWKVGVYYGVCIALVALVGLTRPEWLYYLPLNAFETLQNEPVFFDSASLIDELVTTQRPLEMFEVGINLISAMAGALIVMLPLRWVYVANSPASSRTSDVALSLLVLPLVVTAIIYIVRFSLPLAFSLAAIFAGVRYRTALKGPTDAFYVFACIAVGLAAGTRTLFIALVLAVFFTFTILGATPRQHDPE